MRFAICLLNLFLLWTIVTGQTLCLCTDRDSCHGIASGIISELTPGSAPLGFTSVLSSSKPSDCCSDCFITLESLGASEYIDLSKFQLVISSLSNHFRSTIFAESSKCEHNRAHNRAPPILGNFPGKLYLAKRTLLI